MTTFKRVALAVCTAALMCFALCSCSATENSNSENVVDTPAIHSVVDAYGRNVELPAQVDTVATVGSGARFVVYAGAQDKLIAVTEQELKASPAKPYTIAYKDFFSTLPATSNGNHLMETNVNAEQLLELHPDVIISSRSAAECDELQKNIGIPVVGISYQDQLFTDDVCTSIQVVGDALGTSEHAKHVVDMIKTWEKDLNERTKNITDADKPSVYVGAVNYKGAQSFGGTYCNYAPLMAIHANNVADELNKNGSVIVELEQIGSWNPDYIFLNTGNMDLLKADYASSQEFFDNLTAFKTPALYTQPAFNFNGTNIEMGICDAYFIGSILYPEAFKNVDMASKYSEIFTTMLGMDYYDFMLQNHMDFTSMSIDL